MTMSAEWALRPIGNIDAYISAVLKLPMVTQEEEIMYARKFKQEDDIEAAYKLVLSHLKLVVSVARQYLGYGLPHADLIQEGNIGLMEAVHKFDAETALEKNVRFCNYAMHWIKARIHEYIIKNWRIVKIATTKAQRKLFFNLRSMRQNMHDSEGVERLTMSPKDIDKMAKELNVKREEVIEMEQRFNSGAATPIDTFASDDEDGAAFGPQDVLFDAEDEPENMLAAHQRMAMSGAVEEALSKLPAREQRIIRARWIDVDDAGAGLTLADLSKEFNVSGERIRQIEKKALAMLRTELENQKRFFE